MTTPQPSAPLAADAAPTPLDRPRIYVACLAAYNNGCLHGRWIEATTPDEVMDEVRTMLADSPLPDAEEWAIHDYEGFEGAHLSEYESFETVCNLADFVAEHGRLGALVHRHFGDDLEQAEASFDDYAGTYASRADFAEDLHRDTGTEIPAALEYYIDWSALARDMELGGDIMVFETGFEELDRHAASLWGVECNYPGTDNSYLTTVANELLPEALDAGRAAASRLAATVTGWAAT